MSTRPLPPPAVLAGDPGPWSVVSSVFAQAGAPGRRRPQPPMGLMLSPPPETRLTLAGLDPESRVAGIGPFTVVAGTREPALRLEFAAEGHLTGISPYVVRTWEVPQLSMVSEDRPGDDPTADLGPPVAPDSLDHDELPTLATAPGGGVVAAHTKEGRSDVVAILRVDDGALIRWIRGARAAAWSADGRHLAIGGQWGVVLTVSTLE